MFAVKTCFVRKLSKKDYLKLKMLCLFSNNLYNVSLYHVRQHYFSEKQYLSYEANYHVTKDNENYKLIHANAAQQTMKVVDRSMKSFFALIKKARQGGYQFQDIKLPHYRKKGSLFMIAIPAHRARIRNGYFEVPTSKAFKEIYGKEPILIKVFEEIESLNLKEVRIIPVHNGRTFKVQYVYEQETEPKELNQNNVLAIDVGLDNLATCVTTIGTSFIMDGRKLKSINQWWNKRRAYLQSILAKQGRKTSEQIQRITTRRNNRTNDYLKKTARYIVNYCLNNNIGTIVCGYNPDFKRSINLGSRTNQNFTQISFGNLREQLRNLCERYGMQYVEQEESYTSKASFLDLDDIPVYNGDNPYTGTFSGRRIKRGLYRSANGFLVNADVNGAANILRKSKQNLNSTDFQELCRGVLATPSRIRVF